MFIAHLFTRICCLSHFYNMQWQKFQLFQYYYFIITLIHTSYYSYYLSHLFVGITIQKLHYILILLLLLLPIIFISSSPTAYPEYFFTARAWVTMYVCMYVCICVCTCVYVYICVCVCVWCSNHIPNIAEVYCGNVGSFMTQTDTRPEMLIYTLLHATTWLHIPHTTKMVLRVTTWFIVLARVLLQATILLALLTCFAHLLCLLILLTLLTLLTNFAHTLLTFFNHLANLPHSFH